VGVAGEREAAIYGRLMPGLVNAEKGRVVIKKRIAVRHPSG
jgi:hypothetical protein